MVGVPSEFYIEKLIIMYAARKIPYCYVFVQGSAPRGQREQGGWIHAT